MTDLAASLFGGSGIFYGVILPVSIGALFALIAIPSMLHEGAKPRSVVKATYCYLMQAIGILLMSLGGLPAVYGVIQAQILQDDRFTAETYLALLIIFSSGGLTFLWHESWVNSLDAASRAVPAALYRYLLKTLGVIAVLLSVLSLLITMLLGGRPLAPDFWIMHVTMLLFGTLLSWTLREPNHVSPFRIAGVASRKPPAHMHPLHHAKPVHSGGKKRK